MNGATIMARGTGLFRPSTNLLMTRNRRKPSNPPTRGERNQLAAIWPSLCHSTALQPTATMPKPATAPTIECVVDTGIPRHVAMFSQIAVASRAQAIPRISNAAASCSVIPGIAAMDDGWTMPLRTVSVT